MTAEKIKSFTLDEPVNTPSEAELKSVLEDELRLRVPSVFEVKSYKSELIDRSNAFLHSAQKEIVSLLDSKFDLGVESGWHLDDWFSTARETFQKNINALEIALEIKIPKSVLRQAGGRERRSATVGVVQPERVIDRIFATNIAAQRIFATLEYLRKMDGGAIERGKIASAVEHEREFGNRIKDLEGEILRLEGAGASVVEIRKLENKIGEFRERLGSTRENLEKWKKSIEEKKTDVRKYLNTVFHEKSEIQWRNSQIVDEGWQSQLTDLFLPVLRTERSMIFLVIDKSQQRKLLLKKLYRLKKHLLLAVAVSTGIFVGTHFYLKFERFSLPGKIRRSLESAFAEMYFPEWLKVKIRNAKSETELFSLLDRGVEISQNRFQSDLPKVLGEDGGKNLVAVFTDSESPVEVKFTDEAINRIKGHFGPTADLSLQIETVGQPLNLASKSLQKTLKLDLSEFCAGRNLGNLHAVLEFGPLKVARKLDKGAGLESVRETFVKKGVCDEYFQASR